MDQNKLFKEFNAEEVQLEDSNLIEASAGTGKTFSIAILVLRLLLEKKINIQEILMVTFTKAAVAELEERIRLFVREAYRFAQNEEIEEEKIRNIVSTAINKEGEETVIRLLKTAILNLDETAIMTIHGFCQQTLNEFAFETSQLFSAELVSDTSAITQEEIQKFWRKYITGIQPDLLTLLTDKGLSQGSITSMVNGHLSGKSYIFFDSDTEYVFDLEKQNELIDEFEELEKKAKEAEKEFFNYYESVKDGLIDRFNGYKVHGTTLNAFKKKVDDANLFLSHLNGKREENYGEEFQDILVRFDEMNLSKIDSQEVPVKALNYLYSFAIQKIVPEIGKHKAAYNLLSFDDMISNLHKALDDGKNQQLTEKLQQKFKAVFIDEFQDTDREQYEIFDTAFGKNSILFFIGDPKQSIYGWRKADIATYLRARGKVENLYSMNINYRSDERLVNALNQFFSVNDVFHFGDALIDERFDYIPVKPKPKQNKGLTYNGLEVVPMSVVFKPNKNEIYQDLSLRVLDLLTNPHWELNDNPIRPSDIGILVRSNNDGGVIKEQLAKNGIPAVTVTDSKILQSNEAKELIFLLNAMIKPTRSTINTALSTGFIGYKSSDLLATDHEKAVQQFRSYQNEWKSNGIYTTLMKLIADFNIRQKLIQKHTENGERTLTNLYHLTELLHKTENRKHLNSVELTDWLKINTRKTEVSDDEFEQRIENDEEAVKIVTIHKSKGLEYNIVFAPGLDFNFKENKDKTYGFRNEEGNYVTAKLNQLTDEQKQELIKQEEQENRRLLYVALTRAKNKCFVFRNTHYKSSSLTNFIYDNFEFNELIQQEEAIEMDSNLRYIPETPKTQKEFIAVGFEEKLKGNNWSRISYSGLAADGEYIIKKAFEKSTDEYDKFIFKELRKGAKTGNFVHYIFENIDFSKPEGWEAVIQKAIKRFMPNKDDYFSEKIGQMLSHVINSKIFTQTGKFCLNSVYLSQCLHELEFDFPVKLFNTKQLEKLRDEGISIGNRYGYQVEGIMNGKVDLFFEHRRKFFVLDWKSNYLGPSTADYNSEKVEAAMTENNYHLQYLIYSFAVKKYLESRLGNNFNYDRDFGGVIYLFIRGMREGQNTGVFYTKPSLRQIEKIGKLIEKETVSG